MEEFRKTKRSLTFETPHLSYPLISLVSHDLQPNARKQTISSSPFRAHIFFLSLISFFTVISVFIVFMATMSVSRHKEESSLLVSLFQSDSSFTLPSHPLDPKMSSEESEFWKQESVKDYNCKPCLDFSLEYRKASKRVSKENRRFLVISVSGDLFQWRDQIIDAVVIARILGAALVIPVLKKESGFGPESEFSDIFDVEHFVRILRADVRVMATHPYVHLSSGQVKGFELPRYVSPHWIRTKLRKKLNVEGVLLLTGIGPKLTRKLPPDLQKLRCKVGFEALRFANPVREIGYQLAKRIWIEGPYAAFDLGQNFVNYTHLEGLGVPKSARLYAAGAKGSDGAETLKPLLLKFPNLVTMDTLERTEELSPFVSSSSALAAIDYIVALNSDVFLTSPDSQLGRALQEHRAYTGGKKVLELLGQEELRIQKERWCGCTRGFKLF